MPKLVRWNRNAQISVLAALASLAPLCHARAATVTVTGTGDTVAVDGSVTLREALLSVNAGANINADVVAVGAYGSADTIAFNIPGAGVQTITPASSLPALTAPVAINGYTQGVAAPTTNSFPGALNAVLLVQLSGVFSSLDINGAGTTVRGLVINGNGNDAIRITADNVTISGNFLGTNSLGTAAVAGTCCFGIRISNASSNNVLIGGPAPADRNLISGGTQGSVFVGTNTGLVVQGNFLGTNASGTAALAPPVTTLGLSNVNNALVTRNLVSGNGSGGIFAGDNVVIQGNLVGTQADGVSALGNSNFGISLNGANSTVGGSGAGQPNVIAFNTSGVNVNDGHPGNRISQNSIHDSTFLGISIKTSSVALPLANDTCDPDFVFGNLGQNYPVLTSASILAGNVTVSGTLNSTANTTYRVEFFSSSACHASGNGEGRTFLGFANVPTDGTCNGAFGPLVFSIPGGESIVTATATDPANNTSEFSVCLDAGGAPPATPTPTPTPTPTMSGTATPTSTPAGVPTPTPVPNGPGVVVPTLSGGMLALFCLCLAGLALLLLRR